MFGQILAVPNGQILKNNLAIWSLCLEQTIIKQKLN